MKAAYVWGCVAQDSVRRTRCIQSSDRGYRLWMRVLKLWAWAAQVYQFIMQELVKYRGMYTGMAELLKSGTPGPDLHAHHDLLASALPQGSGGQVPPQSHPQDMLRC